MTDASVPASGLPAAEPQAGHPLARRLRWGAALGVSAALFWTVGWVLIQPVDPGGCISMLGMASPVRQAAMLAVLGVIAGVVAALIVGRSPLEAASAASAVGLAVLNLRGAESDKLGGYLTGGSVAQPVWPTLALVAELWAWLAVIGMAALAGGWMQRARGGSPQPGTDTIGPIPTSAAGAALSALLGYGGVMFLGGTPVDEVLKQQVYFSVWLAMVVAAAAGQFLFQPRAGWWPLLGVGLLGTVAYLSGNPLGGPDAGASVAMRTMRHVAARPLPIEYAALGTLGGLLGVALVRRHVRSTPPMTR